MTLADGTVTLDFVTPLVGDARSPKHVSVRPSGSQTKKGMSMGQLLIRDKDDVVIVSFQQNKILDKATIAQIGAEFKDLTLQAASDRKLLLDFGQVGFMSSMMIGTIVRLNKDCKRDKIKLKCCNIAPSIMEIFEITKLTKILDIHKTGADAIESFGSPRRGWFG